MMYLFMKESDWIWNTHHRIFMELYQIVVTVWLVDTKPLDHAVPVQLMVVQELNAKDRYVTIYVSIFFGIVLYVLHVKQFRFRSIC